MVPWTDMSQPSIDILIGSAVFVQLARMSITRGPRYARHLYFVAGATGRISGICVRAGNGSLRVTHDPSDPLSS